MLKKAIIISSPSLPRYGNYLPGVNIDKVNWYNYFRSATGGGFYQWEIIPLVNPTANDVYNAVRNNWTEYTVVVFSGHGSYSTTAQTTMLNINPLQRISVKDLIGNSPKQQLIIDCCRNRDTGSHFNFIGSPGPIYLTFPSRLTPEEGRRVHASKLNELDNGIGVMHAASIGESSWSNGEQGSHFSTSILTTARNWATHYEDKSILNAAGALRFSKVWLKKYFGNKQSPVICSGSANFPFAVRYGTEIDNWNWQKDRIEGWQRNVAIYR